MEVVDCQSTGEKLIILTYAEAADLKEMVKGASLPLRRTFNNLLSEI